MREYHIAIYMRVSSDDANEGESDSIINQRGLIYDYIRKTSELKDAVVEDFVDDGYSGKNFERPAVTALLDKVASGDIDCIIVKDFSRFGRNHLEAGKYLETIFPFYNVRFISVNDLFDSAKQPYGTSGMEVALRNLIHETYIRDISDKIRSVQRYKMKKGEYFYGMAPFGYVKSNTEKNKLAIDPEAAETVRYIFKLACEGNTPTMLANKLNKEQILTPLMYRKKQNLHYLKRWTSTNETNIWTDCIVRLILQDRRYTGDMVGHRSEKTDVLSNRTVQIPEEERIVVLNTHESIVSREVFEVGKSVIKKIRKQGYNPPVQTLFSRILRCGHCRHMLIYKRTKQPYYKCRFDQFSSECSLKFDEAVLAKAILNILMTKFSFYQNERTDVPKYKRDNIEKEITQLGNLISCQKNALDSCIANYAKGKMAKEVFIEKKQEIRNAIAESEYRKQELSELLLKVNKDDNEHISLCASMKLTREVIERFIETIYAYNDNTIEIVWKDKVNEDISIRFLIYDDGSYTVVENEKISGNTSDDIKK